MKKKFGLVRIRADFQGEKEGSILSQIDAGIRLNLWCDGTYRTFFHDFK